MMNKEDMVELLKSEPLLQAYIGAFTLMFSQGIVTYMLPVKVEALALKASTTGMMLSVFGITAILFFLLPTNRIYDRFNRSKLMLIGIAVMAFALSLLGLFATKGMLFIVMMIYGMDSQSSFRLLTLYSLKILQTIIAERHSDYFMPSSH